MFEVGFNNNSNENHKVTCTTKYFACTDLRSNLETSLLQCCKVQYRSFALVLLEWILGEH